MKPHYKGYVVNGWPFLIVLTVLPITHKHITAKAPNYLSARVWVFSCYIHLAYSSVSMHSLPLTVSTIAAILSRIR